MDGLQWLGATLVLLGLVVGGSELSERCHEDPELAAGTRHDILSQVAEGEGQQGSGRQQEEEPEERLGLVSSGDEKL